jgi:hypothetical protein
MRQYSYVLLASALVLPQAGNASEVWKCNLSQDFPGLNIPVPRPHDYWVQIEKSIIDLFPVGGDLGNSFAVRNNSSTDVTGQRQDAIGFNTIHLNKKHRTLHVVFFRKDGTTALKQQGSCVLDTKQQP